MFEILVRILGTCVHSIILFLYSLCIILLYKDNLKVNLIWGKNDMEYYIEGPMCTLHVLDPRIVYAINFCI